MASNSQHSLRPRKRCRQKTLLFLIILTLALPQATSGYNTSDEATQTTQATHQIECVQPAINEFPEDIFTDEERQNGGIIFHLVITMYLCATLGLVCDRYFVPSLELICEILHVPSDIAGATFMAIGTSAPELFSSVIGSFITEGDIGVGAIVGSAVFNVIGITGLAGLAVWKMSVPIDWYPITRDLIAYLISIIALIVILNDNTVIWYEAVILLVMFVLYVLVMVYNSRIEDYSQEKFKYFKSKFSGYNNLDFSGKKNTTLEKSPLLGSKTTYIIVEEASQPEKKKPKKKVKFQDEYLQIKDDSEECLVHSYQYETVVVTTTKKEVIHTDMNGNDIEAPFEDEKKDDTIWTIPTSGVVHRIFWVLTWPVCFLMYLTIPDCRIEKNRKYYLLTFSMAVSWIAGCTYLSVWMVTVIGYTFGLPDSISGITLLAIGTSVPEIISSIIVVRNGLGNMAICNLIGSNVFNIVFCLGAPWLIKTLLNSDDGSLVINSSAMTFTVITLLGTVVILYVLFISTKWMLNRNVGFACILMYMGFLVLAVYYELELATGALPTCT